ncbi:hypothetical protein IGI04_003440 [Brassica rapa subsp. trilocularis]|uniref:Uncharacterized protein n=1 Tax=Brassica rapa subsp. trilocularis TaxID=1813537 RepID=A0ABQ7NYE1_BRACM|nr:hypothetical protein IGI04_003440 [Brassica rapa subsp. trilocularis]
MTESTDKKKKEKTPQHGFRAQHRIGELGGSVKPWGFELVEILRHHEICCSRNWFCIQSKQEQVYDVSVYLALAHSSSLGPGWDRGSIRPMYAKVSAR